ARPRGGLHRQERRLRPAVLDVLEDDGRVEDGVAVVYERRDLTARAHPCELLVAAEEGRHLQVELHALLVERDLDLLRVGRERVLVERRHARTRAQVASRAQDEVRAQARPGASPSSVRQTAASSKRKGWIMGVVTPAAANSCTRARQC